LENIMANTDFSFRQGESWSRTITLEDEDCVPIALADSNSNAQKFFAGMATKTGEDSVPILFKYSAVETKTYGRGSAKSSSEAVFGVSAYIPADEVGSCSIAEHITRTACVGANGTWTVDSTASLSTTTKMAVGDWSYEVRVADVTDPSGLESSTTILYGTLSVSASTLDLSPGAGFTFVTPT
jgi:hypothetical protein